jgi:hypothetical protein
VVLPTATITVRDTTDNNATPNGFLSRHEVTISDAVIPKLTADVHADSLIGISLEPEQPGFWTTAPVRNGTTTSTVENASGKLILMILVRSSTDDIGFKFVCGGAECTTKYLPLTTPQP